MLKMATSMRQAGVNSSSFGKAGVQDSVRLTFRKTVYPVKEIVTVGSSNSTFTRACRMYNEAKGGRKCNGNCRRRKMSVSLQHGVRGTKGMYSASWIIQR